MIRYYKKILNRIIIILHGKYPHIWRWNLKRLKRFSEEGCREFNGVKFEQWGCLHMKWKENDFFIFKISKENAEFLGHTVRMLAILTLTGKIKWRGQRNVNWMAEWDMVVMVRDKMAHIDRKISECHDRPRHLKDTVHRRN